jgi:NADH-quinone oxidoreductase subunit E/NADP-reducing hydrogenase subunit HndA
MSQLNAISFDTIKRIIEEHKHHAGPIKLILHEIQNELGYIPFEAMKEMSSQLNVPISEIYSVVSFYTQFTLQPKGKHVLNICMGTACYVKGAQALIEKFQELTGAKLNSTSENGLFSLDSTRCLGACGLAPVAVLDGVVYANAINNSSLEYKVRDILHQEERKANENYGQS